MDLTRVTGNTGVSVGTHLALYRMFPHILKPFDEKEKNKDTPFIQPLDYTGHIFNIYTLLRNFLNSYSEKNKQLLLNNSKVANEFVNEMHSIASYYNTVTTKPVIYVSTYKDIFRIVNKEKLKPNDKHFLELIEYEKFVKKHMASFSGLPIYFTMLTDFTKGKSLLTTHLAVDLLYNNIKDFDLLESHTGRVLTKFEFNKKYHKIGDKDLSIFPFNKKLLFLLGDNTMTTPIGIEFRKELYNIATTNKWTVRTTNEKIMYDIIHSSKLNFLGTILSQY